MIVTLTLSTTKCLMLLLRFDIIFIEVPPGIANLTQLEMLNLFNNHIEELPVSLSSMPKLRILNVG